MEKGKVYFFLISLFFTIVILSWIWGPGEILNFKNSEDIANVAIEFHGMVFDVLLFGIILTIYEAIRSKKEKVRKLQEEIDDYRGWDEKEAMYRIVGNIRRLNKEGVSIIDTTNCYLQNASLTFINFKKAILSSTNFKQADLFSANLQGAYLLLSNLEEAILRNALLQGARMNEVNLQKTDLRNTNLLGADLSNANLKGVMVHSSNWFNILKGWNVVGIEDIMRKYYVNPIPKKDKYDQIYFIVNEKQQQQCNAVTKKGIRCSRVAKTGFNKCSQHLGK